MSQMTNKKGFTLLEVLLAMVLLSTALVMLAESWSAAFNRVQKTQTSFVLSSLLERKMDDYIRKFKGKPLEEIPDEESDDFDDSDSDKTRHFSWKMTSKKFEFPDIASTLASRDGGVDPMTQQIVKQMTDQISKSVKELTVKVIYKHPKKSIEVSATTYFIDYDKPIALGGATQ